MNQKETNQSEYNKLCRAKANWLDMLLIDCHVSTLGFRHAFERLDEEDQNLLDEHYETERK